MSDLGIFLFGFVVTGLVAIAISLIIWGAVTERRDRLELEAEQASRGVGPRAGAQPSTTTATGGTVSLGD